MRFKINYTGTTRRAHTYCFDKHFESVEAMVSHMGLNHHINNVFFESTPVEYTTLEELAKYVKKQLFIRNLK